MVSKNKNTFHRTGFTIVELTIVIVVIGILAAIAVVGYGAWRQRVSEDAVKSDLTNVSSSMENAKNFSEGYPVYTVGTVFDGSNSSKGVFVQSDDVVLTYREGDAKSYCIEGYSNTRPGVTFFTDTEIDNGKPARGTCSAGKQIPGEIAWQESNQSAVYKWAQVFIANDGQHIMARASNYSHTFASSDGGQGWSQATIGGSGSAKAFDFTPQGSLGIATNNSSYGTTYLSSDYGATWQDSTSSPRITWSDVVISAEGNNMIGFLSPATNGTLAKAARYNQDPSHPYYYRIRSQGSVSPTSPSVRWIDIDASDDLTTIVGATIDGPIYTLSGGTWVERTSAGSRAWSSVSMSADGQHIVAAVDGGSIYTSINGGGTWVERTSAGSRAWRSVSMSADGQHIVAGSSNGYIYTSKDGGGTWKEETSAGSRYWTGVAISSNGNYYAAGSGGGGSCSGAGGCVIFVGKTIE